MIQNLYFPDLKTAQLLNVCPKLTLKNMILTEIYHLGDVETGKKLFVIKKKLDKKDKTTPDGHSDQIYSLALTTDFKFLVNFKFLTYWTFFTIT
jgi:hypothetical protein